MGSGKLWLHGLIAAFIGGGAGAVSAGFASAMVAPGQFNLGGGLLGLLKLMGVTFIVSGAIAVAAYLKQSPVPDDWDGKDRRGDLPPAPKP